MISYTEEFKWTVNPKLLLSFYSNENRVCKKDQDDENKELWHISVSYRSQQKSNNIPVENILCFYICIDFHIHSWRHVANVLR